MSNLCSESHKNHWGESPDASGHFKTGFSKKYSDPAELDAFKVASVSKTSKINGNSMKINKKISKQIENQ